jgi:opacity protein-like surface antigen
MRKLLTGVVILILIFAPQAIKAQDRWNLEVRVGGNYATQELGDAELGTGFGFETTLSYAFMPKLAAYAGWGWNQFFEDESFAGKDMDFEETGYTFGLQFMNSCKSLNFDYLVRAGGIYNHIEVENSDGDIIDDSKHGLGWQVGAGVMVPLTRSWKIIPGVRYRSLSRELEDGSDNIDVDLNYISAGLGLSMSF